MHIYTMYIHMILYIKPMAEAKASRPPKGRDISSDDLLIWPSYEAVMEITYLSIYLNRYFLLYIYIYVLSIYESINF